MSRLLSLRLFAVSLSIPVAALAETSAEKAARIQAAVAACDKGAAVPLDPEATAPPGPAGVEEKARAEAATELARLDAEAQ